MSAWISKEIQAGMTLKQVVSRKTRQYVKYINMGSIQKNFCKCNLHLNLLCSTSETIVTPVNYNWKSFIELTHGVNAGETSYLQRRQSSIFIKNSRWQALQLIFGQRPIKK